MNYAFLPEAEAEYLEAIRFFEAQRSGLGATLIKEFERTMMLAVERPHAWKVVNSAGIRRIGMKRFPSPFSFAACPGQPLVITAVAHNRRRPGYWIRRIDSR